MTTAAQAIRIANGYLTMSVGDLLMAGVPQHENFAVGPVWVMPIELAYLSGLRGEVGTIRVTRAGEVIFTDADRAEVERRSEELAASRPTR
jgi:hypothetical protein